LQSALDRLAIKAPGRFLGRLGEQHVKLPDEAACSSGLSGGGPSGSVSATRNRRGRLLPVLRLRLHAVHEVVKRDRTDAGGAGHGCSLELILYALGEFTPGANRKRIFCQNEVRIPKTVHILRLNYYFSGTSLK
jgi:hypothetical protein